MESQKLRPFPPITSSQYTGRELQILFAHNQNFLPHANSLACNVYVVLLETLLLQDQILETHQ
eukprot:Gb_31275 [translate_table: standard]